MRKPLPTVEIGVARTRPEIIHFQCPECVLVKKNLIFLTLPERVPIH